MSEGFAKVDCGILDSSLWVQRDARSVFLTALFMGKPFVLDAPTPQINVRDLTPTGWMVPAGRYGFVKASGGGIIRRDGIEEEAGLVALEMLSATDLDSRSEEYEGRRLARISGGYVVLNYKRYRDMDHTTNQRSQRYRDRQRMDEAAVTRDDRDVGVTGRDPSASASASRVALTKLLEEFNFAEFASTVEGYVRATPGVSGLAVSAILRLHLTGESGYERATPAQVGASLMEYMASGEQRFTAPLFAGYLRRAKRGVERTEARQRNTAEARHMASVEAEQEARLVEDSAMHDLVNTFQAERPADYVRLLAAAEREVPAVITMGRGVMVRGVMVRMIREGNYASE